MQIINTYLPWIHTLMVSAGNPGDIWRDFPFPCPEQTPALAGVLAFKDQLSRLWPIRAIQAKITNYSLQCRSRLCHHAVR